MSDNKIEAHYCGEEPEQVIGLYVDGRLAKIGPQSEVVNYVIGMLGIKQVYSDDFFLGQASFAGVAKSLDEINAYKRVAHAEEAHKLREQAAELLRKAAALEGITEGE